MACDYLLNSESRFDDNNFEKEKKDPRIIFSERLEKTDIIISNNHKLQPIGF